MKVFRFLMKWTRRIEICCLLTLIVNGSIHDMKNIVRLYLQNYRFLYYHCYHNICYLYSYNNIDFLYKIIFILTFVKINCYDL